MGEIHRTTMTPTKLELLSAWLPHQPWYQGDGKPDLAKGGGFRLDDPAGVVGIELMVVIDQREPFVRYLVPLTYRGAPLKGAERALIGTSEHGVLGTRWVYDGIQDLVAVDQLIALVRGQAEPQAQSESWAPDPTVQVRGDVPAAGSAAVQADAGQLRLELSVPRGPMLVAELPRVLSPVLPDGLVGAVVAGWQLPDGTEERGAFLVVR